MTRSHSFDEGWLTMSARLAARHVRNSLRATRSQTRDAYRAYRAGLWQRGNAAASSSVEMRSIDALRAQVRYAAGMSFWRDRFERAGLRWSGDFSFEDFALLPALERDEIADAGDALLHPDVPASQRRKMATGGSTGKPTVVWTGPEERGWTESAIEYFEARLGVRPGDRRALLWGHNLDPVNRASRRERLEDWIENREWFDCFRLSDDVLLQYHQRLEQFRPRVMVAYASALASLADTLARAGVSQPSYPTLGFITGAEKLYDDQRQLIERVFGKPVFERYGGRDLGLIAAQVPNGGHTLEVDWRNVVVELDQPGQEGALLVTKLHADAMPLFRYRTGDIARIPNASPGSVVTTIDEIVGRELQRIWMPDGNWMHGTVVPHLMKDYDVHDYQLRQRKDYSVELLVVPRAGFDAASEEAVLTALRHSLPTLPLTVVRVESVARTAAAKWLPVVSEARAPKPHPTASEGGRQ